MTIDLTDKETLTHLLQQKGLTPSRESGQNFLICSEPIDATLMALEGGAKKITELGAGAGPLTQRLLEQDFQVRAIEQDETLISIMKKVIPKKTQVNLNIVIDDLKRVDWQWKEPYQLVGNIPYNLSGLILKNITHLDPTPERVVLMVQKEVGHRLTADSSNISLLSLMMSLWGEVHELMNVPAHCFYPEPKVDSQLILIKPHQKQFSLEKRERIIQLAKIFFNKKRKQIGGVLKKQFDLEQSTLENILASTLIRREQRPQELTVKQWELLDKSLSSLV